MGRTVRIRHSQQDFGAFDIVFAGILTTVGGSATEVFKIRGVESTDVAIAVRHTTTTRSINTLAAGKHRVTVVFDNDPSTTHKINLLVIRPRFKAGAAHRHY
jgi:hypothetical protein